MSFYYVISINEEWLREFFAELLGTFFLVFMGNNAVAGKVLTYSETGSPLTVYLGYALGLFVGLLVSVGVSGGHLNPAVTVAGAVVRRLRWSKVPHYLFAQYLGGFLAACCTYLIYMDSFDTFHNDNGVNITSASVFATYPRENVSLTASFIDQILGTMVLVIAIYAITDELNINVPQHLVALYVSLVLLGIGCSLGVDQGFAVNPARDLSPRIFTVITVWGSEVFGSQSYWYVPIIGPHLGAILGAGIYITFFERLRNFTGDDLDNNNNTNSNQSNHNMLAGPAKPSTTNNVANSNITYSKTNEKPVPTPEKIKPVTSSNIKSETYTCYL